MIKVNYLAVAAAAVAAFVASSVWYIVFSKQLIELSAAAGASRSLAWTFPEELVRNLVLGAVLAGLGAQLGIVTWRGAVRLGLAMWIGFPVVLLSGSVFWENVSWQLAALHAGDWLVKLLVIAVMVSVWHRKGD